MCLRPHPTISCQPVQNPNPSIPSSLTWPSRSNATPQNLLSRKILSMPAKDLSKFENLPSEAEIEQIKQALAGLRFGSVQIIVQDGLIVQIERTEKLRVKSNRNRG